MDKIAILLNPSAGRGKAKKNRRILENSLRYYGLDYDISESKSPSHLVRLATEKSKVYEVIIGAGGDGTFDIIINELIKQSRGNIFGMISLGSQNDIVREFGVDSLEKACSAIKGGETRQVDLGVLTADGSEPLYFLGSASLGLGTTVNKYVENLVRKHPILTRFEFTDSILGVLGIYNAFSAKEVPIPLTLKYGNKPSFTNNFSLVVFTNTGFYAGGIKPNLDATPYDGLLDCCCVTGDSFFRFLNIYGLTIRSQHIAEKDVKLIKASEFKILSERGVEIQADGEVRGPYKQITLYVQPRALRLIVHPNYVEGK